MIFLTSVKKLLVLPGFGGAVFVVGAYGRDAKQNCPKMGNPRPWCRSKPCKAKALREIAARHPSKPWCRNRSPNQCADNNNFQKRPDMVPSSLILPSENPPIFAQKANFRFCAERADFLHEHYQEIRCQRRIAVTANLQSGCRIRAD